MLARATPPVERAYYYCVGFCCFCSVSFSWTLEWAYRVITKYIIFYHRPSNYKAHRNCEKQVSKLENSFRLYRRRCRFQTSKRTTRRCDRSYLGD